MSSILAALFFFFTSILFNYCSIVIGLLYSWQSFLLQEVCFLLILIHQTLTLEVEYAISLHSTQKEHLLQKNLFLEPTILCSGSGWEKGNRNLPGTEISNLVKTEECFTDGWDKL